MRDFLSRADPSTNTWRKFNISSKLIKLRYLCKFYLQLCAVLSQLNKYSARTNL